MGDFTLKGFPLKKRGSDPSSKTIKEIKWAKLNAMLDVLDVTEDIQKNREKNSATPTEMFCSSTTLTSFRLTINSAMALAEEMLANDYHTVLTGKWNQDAIEVRPLYWISIQHYNTLSINKLQRFFGIARSIDNTPTAHSWLHIFRVLSLYNLSQNVVRNGNVDNEDELTVLVAYKKCLVARFKDREELRHQVKSSLKEKLSELTLRSRLL